VRGQLYDVVSFCTPNMNNSIFTPGKNKFGVRRKGAIDYRRFIEEIGKLENLVPFKCIKKDDAVIRSG
jgi:hypothetical protein